MTTGRSWVTCCSVVSDIAKDTIFTNNNDCVFTKGAVGLNSFINNIINFIFIALFLRKLQSAAHMGEY